MFFPNDRLYTHAYLNMVKYFVLVHLGTFRLCSWGARFLIGILFFQTPTKYAIFQIKLLSKPLSFKLYFTLVMWNVADSGDFI